jgi:hypothetical protein
MCHPEMASVHSGQGLRPVQLPSGSMIAVPYVPVVAGARDSTGMGSSRTSPPVECTW